MPHKSPDEVYLVYLLICAFFMFIIYMIWKNVAYGMVGGGFIGGIIAYYILEFDQGGEQE